MAIEKATMDRLAVVAVERVIIPQTPITCIVYAKKGIVCRGTHFGRTFFKLPKEVMDVIDDDGEINFKRLGTVGENYVFVYKNQRRCSDVGLRDLEGFFEFEIATYTDVTAAAKDPDNDPFLFDNKTLLDFDPTNDSLKAAIHTAIPPRLYSWARDPLRGWGWNETVWNQRLGACLKKAFPNLSINECFTWTPSTYKANPIHHRHFLHPALPQPLPEQLVGGSAIIL